MPASLMLKQGATLQLLINATDDAGAPLDLTTITVSADVRNNYLNLVDTLTFTPTSTVGQLAVAQDTALWPTGVLTCDFKFVQGAVILKSDTLTINVILAVTP